VVSGGGAYAPCPHLTEKARCSEDDYHKPTPGGIKPAPAPAAYYKQSPGGYKKTRYSNKHSPSGSSYVVKAAPSADSYASGGYHVIYRPVASSDSYAPSVSTTPAASSDSTANQPAPSSNQYAKPAPSSNQYAKPAPSSNQYAKPAPSSSQYAKAAPSSAYHTTYRAAPSSDGYGKRK
jgi:hypothetical protein